MKALTIILTFSIIATFPQETLTMLNHTQQQINETRLSGGCDYTVTIKTSCDSPSLTKDEISLLFGDANGSEVYVPRLDDPGSGSFEQCTTMTYEILGPCIGKICKMYLFRNGTDGWKPETVTAYHHDNPPAIFNYNVNIPQDAGYGYNNCDKV